MGVESIAARLPYRMGYKSPTEREEIMERRRENIAFANARGHSVSFKSHLLSDCSPFTEWCARHM
ncbi:hypothetical protein AQZ52_10815 [Novosphingobium fuchskuhlense]|uniref:Uncharacterized protein n=1 Tax=Novosphingobium fuchskuhlense TaxID=1117702 RepID=A0A117UUM6_9SPHN|nr:hypothetical protein [Novosphingobium fuchskuhlense]KUR71155.1 hypothetical protein AQZ52_10815 [Novosphingobium fuchskuhlense]